MSTSNLSPLSQGLNPTKLVPDKRNQEESKNLESGREVFQIFGKASLQTNPSITSDIKVGDILKVQVISSHAFGVLVELLSRKPLLEKKSILIRPDALQKHFPKTTPYPDFIRNGDIFDVSVASLPSEKQKQIFVDLTEKTVSFLHEREKKLSEGNQR